MERTGGRVLNKCQRESNHWQLNACVVSWEKTDANFCKSSPIYFRILVTQISIFNLPGIRNFSWNFFPKTKDTLLFLLTFSASPCTPTCQRIHTVVLCTRDFYLSGWRYASLQIFYKVILFRWILWELLIDKLLTIIHSKFWVGRRTNSLASVQSHSTKGGGVVFFSLPLPEKEKLVFVILYHSLFCCYCKWLKIPAAFLFSQLYHLTQWKTLVLPTALLYQCLNQQTYNVTVKSLKCNRGQLGFCRARFRCWWQNREQDCNDLSFQCLKVGYLSHWLSALPKEIICRSHW